MVLFDQAQGPGKLALSGKTPVCGSPDPIYLATQVIDFANSLLVEPVHFGDPHGPALQGLFDYQSWSNWWILRHKPPI
jgi:hypothetical protein